jgi:hypothetical protein
VVKRSYRSLSAEDGQALVEVPYAVLLSCLLVLLAVQPVIFLYTQMTLSQIATGIGRIAATEEASPSESRERLIRSYAADKLEGLPKGKAFRIPGTLQIEIEGNAQSERIEVVVSLMQEPLPVVGLLFAAGRDGQREVIGRAATRGAQVDVEGTAQTAPQHYGNVGPQ